jgi:hypothetical protein
VRRKKLFFLFFSFFLFLNYFLNFTFSPSCFNRIGDPSLIDLLGTGPPMFRSEDIYKTGIGLRIANKVLKEIILHNPNPNSPQYMHNKSPT